MPLHAYMYVGSARYSIYMGPYIKLLVIRKALCNIHKYARWTLLIITPVDDSWFCPNTTVYPPTPRSNLNVTWYRSRIPIDFISHSSHDVSREIYLVISNNTMLKLQVHTCREPDSSEQCWYIHLRFTSWNVEPRDLASEHPCTISSRTKLDGRVGLRTVFCKLRPGKP